MPIKSCLFPNGKSGFRWGDHGKCYADRADAERQAAAAHANGYAGDGSFKDRAGWAKGRADGLAGKNKAAAALWLVAAARWAEADRDRTPEKEREAEEAEAKAVTASKTSPVSDAMALDKATVRRVDQDGRLYIETTNISKANVCPYLGQEVPKFEELGLDPDKTYYLFRDPEELKKAAPTFNNLPVLDKHVPVFSNDHRPENVVGSTGTDAEFIAPYLRNSMVVWAQRAIDGVENGRQREISCAYWYNADMTPGTHDGKRYDGVMRDIRGNHVALVEEGRAGPDVLVSDSKLVRIPNMALSKKAAMVKGALLAHWPNLAADADIGSLVQLLDGLKGEDVPDGTDEEVTPPPPENESKEVMPPPGDEEDDDEDDEEALLNRLQSLLDKLDRRKTAVDGPLLADPGVRQTAKGDEEPKDDDDKVDKAAMDRALVAAVKQAKAETKAEMRAVALAEDGVRPLVGKLAGAFDSAEAVYAAALRNMGVDIAGISGVPALKALVHAHGIRRNETKASVAMDSASQSDFDKAFPDAKRIRVL